MKICEFTFKCAPTVSAALASRSHMTQTPSPPGLDRFKEKIQTTDVSGILTVVSADGESRNDMIRAQLESLVKLTTNV